MEFPAPWDGFWPLRRPILAGWFTGKVGAVDKADQGSMLIYGMINGFAMFVSIIPALCCLVCWLMYRK